MSIIPKDICRVHMVMNTRPLMDNISNFLKGIPTTRKRIADYIFANSDPALEKFRQNVVAKIYTKIAKNEGRIDEAVVPYKRRVNQYTTDFGIFFDYTVHPGMAAIVSEGPIDIVPKAGKKLLTIPKYDSDAFPNKRLADFKGRVYFNPAIRRGRAGGESAGSAGTPYWYLKGEGKGGWKNRTILFWGKKKITRTPVTNLSELRDLYMPRFNDAINTLTSKALTKYTKSFY